MSHSAIRNPHAYQDRTVQDWHRDTFGPDAHAIDIDLMGACSDCRYPLYLIEASTNPNKATTIIRHLAEMAGLPAFLVLHSAGQITRARVICGMTVPDWGGRMTRLQLEGALAALRLNHSCEAQT